MLVLQSDAIDLVHWERRWRGWSLQCAVRQPTDLESADGEALQASLRAVFAQISVPAGSPVALVLSAAHGGLSLLAGEATGDRAAALAATLPFQPSETLHLTLPVDRRPGLHSLLWVHRDTLDDFSGLLGKHGLRLTDIFARAQLAAGYRETGLKTPGADDAAMGTAIIEDEGDGVALHLFLPSGAPFRSTRLPRYESPAQTAGRVSAELAAAGSHGLVFATVVLATSRVGSGLHDALLATGMAVCRQEPLTVSILAERLWFSTCEGLWLSPPRAELARGFNRWAMGIAAVGAAIFFAMLWKTAQYEKEISDLAASVKKLKPRYEKALAMEQEAVRTSETLRGVGDLEQLPRPLDPLALLAEGLPDGAWLTEFSYRQGTVHLAGYGRDVADIRAPIASLPGFSELRATELPPVREGFGQPFALAGRWQPAPAKATDSGTRPEGKGD